MHLFVSPVKSLLRRYDIFLKSHISNPFNVNKPKYYQVSKLNTCQRDTFPSFPTNIVTISVNPVPCLNSVIGGDVNKHCVGASIASGYFHKPGNSKSPNQVASTFKAFIRKVTPYPPQAANLTVVNTGLQHKVRAGLYCMVFSQGMSHMKAPIFIYNFLHLNQKDFSVLVIWQILSVQNLVPQYS